MKVNPTFTEPKSEQSETWDTDYGAEASTFAQETRTAPETYSTVVGGSLPPLPKEIVDSSIPSENIKLMRERDDLRRNYDELKGGYEALQKAKEHAVEQLKKERKNVW